MKLYGYFRSSTSYRLRLALQLKGLEYENCPVNLVEGQQKGEAFAGRNPFATVPMLEVDGKDRVGGKFSKARPTLKTRCCPPISNSATSRANSPMPSRPSCTRRSTCRC